jgi:biopolymer transport protein ExbD
LKKILSILIQIVEKEDFYLNNQKTSFHKLSKQIDSLGSVGYNDSILILVADKQVMIETIVKVMNYAHETNRQIILKSN